MQGTPVDSWLGRSPGEGIGYPLLYSWASLVPQLVKSPPTMRETWVRFLGWEDSPGEGKGCALQYSGLENPMHYTESDTTERLSLMILYTLSHLILTNS